MPTPNCGSLFRVAAHAAMLLMVCALWFAHRPVLAQAPVATLVPRLAGVAAQLSAQAPLNQRLAQCPGDLYRSASTWTLLSGRFRAAWFKQPKNHFDHCAQNPEACLAACTQDHNERACFQLGRVLQDHPDVEALEALPEGDPATQERDRIAMGAEILFTEACVLGGGSGCTNRGAGIRNGNYRLDPLRPWPPEKKQACQFKTFKAACQADDPWGCTMLGQSYQEGEGVAVDHGMALKQYDRSCQLDPDFSACDMAKRKAERLRSRQDGPQ